MPYRPPQAAPLRSYYVRPTPSIMALKGCAAEERAVGQPPLVHPHSLTPNHLTLVKIEVDKVGTCNTHIITNREEVPYVLFSSHILVIID